MPERFLALQSNYKVLSIGLCEEGKILDTLSESRLTASSSLVPLAQQLLQRNNVDLSDLSGIMIDQGPGAFGSLRVLLSTVNAISFASKIPLIGVDGLDALAHDVVDNYVGPRPDETILLVPILNAYNVECYYGIYEVNLAQKRIVNTITRSYTKAYTLFSLLETHHAGKKLMFVGNATSIYESMIQETLGTRSTIVTDQFDLASLQTIVSYGFKKWREGGERTYRLMPLYLKTQMYATAPRAG